VQSNDIIDVLENKEARTFICQHIAADTSLLSLKYSSSANPNFTVWLQLIKLLAKAKFKLPLFYEKLLALDQRSYEQATSQLVAVYKSEFIAGDTLLDITGGLGVDSIFLAASIGEITAVEHNKDLHKMAAYNIQRLGISNIVRCLGDGMSFLSRKYDWVYIDPDRRPDSGRSVALHLLQPNVLDLMPLLQKFATRVYIKLSPLFDIEELYRQFIGIETIHVIAQNGEVKEVGVVLNMERSENSSSIRLRDVATLFDIHLEKATKPNWNYMQDDDAYSFVVLPIALVAKTKSAAYFLENVVVKKHDTFEIFFSNSEVPEGFRNLKIIEKSNLNSKNIKAMLTRLGIRQVNISVKGLRDQPSIWHKKLGTTDGGEYYLLILKSKKSEAILTKIFS
jgi:hypothetical protein